MRKYIQNFSNKIITALHELPKEEIEKAIDILQAAYERDGRIYIFGNGGSLAIASHWVSDFNKTVFSHRLGSGRKRFQAIRVPTTDSEITAWANDIGYDMVFAGPLANYIQDLDVVIAISSSGDSPNIIKAVELAKSYNVPVIGLTGFDGSKLHELADAKITTHTPRGEYEIIESVHGAVMHLLTRYFRDYFEYLAEKGDKQ